MKKTVAGMAALCASCASFAQSPAPSPEQAAGSLKVYGVADLAIAHYRTSGESKTAMHPGGSGSRIGFLAGEDLGGGWTVNARLEAGVNMDTGTSSSTNGNAGRVFSRQAYIEIDNREWGAVRLGRQQGPTYSFFGTYDPMLMPAMDAWGVLSTLGFGSPGAATGTGKSGGFLINPTTRTENTVAYLSPRVRGVQANLAYSLSEDSLTQPHLLEAGVDYATGPLQVGLLLVKAGSTAGTGTIRATAAVTEMALGAKYMAGPVQPYISYIRRNATDPTLGSSGAMLNGNSETVALIGAVIPVSERGNVRLTYGKYASGAANSDARNYGLAYTYDLSRSMMLMAAYTHLSQDRGVRFPVFQSPIPDAGAGVDGLTAGLNWRF